MNLRSARVSSRRALATAPRPGATTIALGVAAALAGAALYNRSRTRHAERDNPPVGRFLELDGAQLHYLDEGPANTGTTGVGAGPPVVLLHGNAVTLDDWIVSGVFDLVAGSRRVVAFDRPVSATANGSAVARGPRQRRRTCCAGPVASSASSALLSSAIPGGRWSHWRGRSRPRGR
jgi:hypothetical protein